MNPLRANFGDLYRRHLCRHSQLGINVIHLAAVLLIYLALFALVNGIPVGPWLLPALLAPYLLVLAFNVPVRVLLTTGTAVASLVALLHLARPPVPVWLALPVIFVGHRLQLWSHRWYPREHDMSEFNERYRKGPALAFLLAVYELPILLHCLLFAADVWHDGDAAPLTPTSPGRGELVRD